MPLLEIGVHHNEMPELASVSDDALIEKVVKAQDDRLFYVSEAIRRGYTPEEIAELTKIDIFYLDKLLHIFEIEQELGAHPQELDVLKTAKLNGFSDRKIAELWNTTADQVRQLRLENKIVPVYKMVDTCAAEFDSETPYFYSTYGWENESIKSDKESVLVLGSGPIRIGQGVEFDYATVHSVKAIQAAGYEAIIMNSNPETVSTDFSVSDKLYFEPLTFEDVMNVIDLEQPKGVIVQFGGQTAINLAEPLAKAGVTILGTQVADLDRAEDRDLFEQALKDLDIPQPPGQTATNEEEAVLAARKIGFPVLVRPSYVLGDVPWKSWKMRKISVLTCVQQLKLVQTTQCLLTHTSLVKSAKLMPFQTEKMSLSLVSWSISNVPVSIQVTQWPFILHKPCRKRCKKQSQTILNA